MDEVKALKRKNTKTEFKDDYLVPLKNSLKQICTGFNTPEIRRAVNAHFD
jgi:hypothetical protein